MSSFELRELFHLNFLHHLSTRLLGRSYALKGGICLRFFHRSPRMSEDIDLDISSHVRRETLENAVDSILESRSFLGTLIPNGITKIEVRKPKQTETTQRWKCTLIVSEDVALHTKIEFSRRNRELFYSKGIPDSQILSQYRSVPFAVQYYNGPCMAAQKIGALASPTRNAARDLFDLYHLLETLSINPKEIFLSIKEDEHNVEQAIEKVTTFSYQDLKEQVLPYLSDSIRELYSSEDSFLSLKSKVEEKLYRIIE